MEDVLEVYQRPFDPKRPLLCMDEISKQLLADSRPPLPMQPGKPERYDYEYVRHGTANTFMFFAPLLAWRHLKVTAQRTRIDWAEAMREVYRRIDTLLGRYAESNGRRHAAVA